MEMNNKCKSYAGYNDLQMEGLFINPYTKEIVDNSLWHPHEPNNFGIGEDCTTIEWDGLLNDISCSSKYCTLCTLEKRPQFELRGFCASDPLDVKYFIQVEDSFKGVYDILGWRDTLLRWSETDKRLEFVELNTQSVVTYCNDTVEYPFGVQS